MNCGRMAGKRLLPLRFVSAVGLYGAGTQLWQVAATSINRQENNVLLAELEQNLLKHEDWPGAPQDGEGLPSKQGVSNPRHGRSKQGFNCTLRRRKNQSPRPSTDRSCLTYADSAAPCLDNHLLLSKRGVPRA